MKLLARYDRQPRRPEANFKPGGRRRLYTFEESAIALDKALDALGVERIPFPPEKEGGDEAPGPDGNDPSART